MDSWYSKSAPVFNSKKSKSILHPFTVNNHKGNTLNLYQGCQHRCGYCYATYEWSPEFYDKIYAKSNAPEILESQLLSWKSAIVHPVMISSATDAYQPAELKFELTRKCVKILQKYNIPYYVFTKSALISRDLTLHEQYKHNCFLVWSITTCNENIRRIIEPGTPPSFVLFKVIKRFSDRGIRCAVNIDPILPLITDSLNEIESIIDNCFNSGVHYVFGAPLRLRSDIWERMKIVFKLVNKKETEVIRQYTKLYHFKEPMRQGYNLYVDKTYADTIQKNLKEKVMEKGMLFDFPHLDENRYMSKKKIKDNNKDQLTLLNFIQKKTLP
jgi:DNA repair photolyase